MTYENGQANNQTKNNKKVTTKQSRLLCQWFFRSRDVNFAVYGFYQFCITHFANAILKKKENSLIEKYFYYTSVIKHRLFNIAL
jgi:hypothetical protein